MPETEIANQLNKAFEAKNKDINCFVWKLPKEYRNGQTYQKEIKLMDATPEDLNHFYEHCKSMLYNEDKINPGRIVLLDIIKEQILNCTTELYLRYVENTYQSSDREATPRYVYLRSLKETLDKNGIDGELLKSITISATTKNIPTDFVNIPVDKVLDGCLDRLGIFNKRHLTLNFILKLGIWLTKDELKEFNDKNLNATERLDVIKERLGLHGNVNLHNSPYGLSYAELRSMTQLKTKKYSEMPSEQLAILKNKVLFIFSDEVTRQAKQWEERMNQIEEVARVRNIELMN